MLVTEQFFLIPGFKKNLRRRKERFGFGLLGAAMYYRTYSRIMKNGRQERWADTVIRVVEGVLSILKTHCRLNNLPFDEDYWQKIGIRLAEAIFNFRLLPPGRGLWAMSSDPDSWVAQTGSAALFNCAFTDVTDLPDDASWLMDALMVGTGVGFSTHRAGNITLQRPSDLQAEGTVIEDSREGWVDSVGRKISSWMTGGRRQVFDYSQIRPEGAPIKRFGGTASGAGPLVKLHQWMDDYYETAVTEGTSTPRIITDTMTRIASCVVAGNVRRSALIALGSPHDDEFISIKDWNLPENADRMNFDTGWGHTSNNSLALETPDDFDRLPDIAERVLVNGEPGFLNLMNVQKYGRYGEKKADRATGINPCGEIPLESRELCNLVEVFPTRCGSPAEFHDAVELATIYASIVNLLPTHWESTNAVVARNRRIGVSLSGITEWFAMMDRKSDIVRMLNHGYDLVYKTNAWVADFAKVPRSIRLTTVKPSGTISLLAGVAPGMHHPIFSYYLRGTKVPANHPIVPILQKAGVPHEPDRKEPDNTIFFQFPIQQASTRSQGEVSLFENGMRLMLLSKFWADNAVSNTTTFNPETEGKDIPAFLSYIAPFVKSVAMMPHYEPKVVPAVIDDVLMDAIDAMEDSESIKKIVRDKYEEAAAASSGTVYPQMPYTGLTEAQYAAQVETISEVDWSEYFGTDGEDSKFCSNDSCVL